MLVPLNMFKTSSNCFTYYSKAELLFWVLFVICVSCLSLLYCLDCSLQLCDPETCRERANLLALLSVMISCVLVIFPYGVPGQVWYLFVSIPDVAFFPTYPDRKLENKQGKCLAIVYINQLLLIRGSLNLRL